MRVVAFVGDTLVTAVIVAALALYASLGCGEYDPCNNGGPMPYAGFAVAAIAVLVVGYVAFALWVWRGRSIANERRED